MLKDIFKNAYGKIHDTIYSYRTIRLEPSVWVEKNVYFPGEVSKFTGILKYDISPYTKEIIDNLSPTSPVETTAVMKNNQSGFTMTVIVPYICYSIAENPCPIMLISATDDVAQKTVRDKLDPVIRNSGIEHLIKSSDTRKRNQRTGNTDFKKEFAGGNLNIGSYKPSNLRMHSVQVILADEFDDAPRYDKKEGSVRTLLENRTTSYGDSKKILYISTPTVKNASNIEDVYEQGDKRKWNWECPHCKTFIPVEWSIELGEGRYAGIKWEYDENRKLIPESIHYECQCCGGKIQETEKYFLNLSGKWIPTCEPELPNCRSYQLNAIVIPSSFDSWERLVRMWLKACPTNEPIDEGELKSFLNTKLGQTWEERGKAPKATELMNNQRDYEIGIVPDNKCENDGNGKIALLTLCFDLGGVMEHDNEDVRVDWEVVAHSTAGATYRVEHGSIGTFKRGRSKSAEERSNESERDKWTYSHGHKFSVWPEMIKLIERTYMGQSTDGYKVDITLIDTSHFTKLSYDFIREYDHPFVVGIKGYTDKEYRALSKDTPVINRSKEFLGKLYILQVNQIKDTLASNMKLKMGLDGYQPSGFMNFPTPAYGKYLYNNYFVHYESEHRVEQTRGSEILGFAWKKRNSSVENHFFDVAVYTLAAPHIYIDILRKADSKASKLTWEDFVALLNG